MANPVGREVDRVSVRVLPDTSRFLIDLEKYLKRIESRVKVNIPTSLNTTGLEAEARRAATAIEQSVSVDVPVDADTAAAEVELDALARDRTVNFKVDVDRSSFAILENALVGASSALKSVVKVGGGGLAIGGGVEAVAALAVAAAQAAGAVGVLAAAMVSAGGAASVLGLAVGGQVVEMFKQQKLIETTDKALAALTPGTVEYREKLAELTLQQQAFNQTFGPAAQGLDDLKDAWAGFLDATREASVNLIGGTLEVLANILPKLAPAANAAADEMGRLVDQFARFTDGDEFAAFIDWIATSGVQNLSNFVQAMANVTVGLGSILGAFTPFADGMTKSLVGLTDGFRDWAKEAAKAGTIQDFAETSVQAFGDLAALLGDIVGSLAAIGKAAGAAGGSLAGGLGVIFENLNEFLNSVPGQNALKGFFEGINKGFAALGQAMVPVSRALTKVLPALGSILGDAGKVIGGILAALAPALAALAGPLATVADLLATTLTSALKGLAPSLAALASGVGDGLIQLVQGLAPLLPQVVTGFVTLADALVKAILPVLPQLVTALIAMEQAVLPLIPSLVDALVPALIALGPAFVAVLQAVPPLAQAMTPFLVAVIALVKPLADIVASILSIPGLTTAATVALLPLRLTFAVLTPIIEAVARSLEILASLVRGDFKQAFVQAGNVIGGFLDPVIEAIDKIIEKIGDAIEQAQELAGLIPGVDGPGQHHATGQALPWGNTTNNITAHDYHDFIRQQHDSNRRRAVGGTRGD